MQYYTSVLVLCWLALAALCILVHENNRMRNETKTAFYVTYLTSGDAAPFLAVSVPGTVLTVLLKGTLCGLAAGWVYRLIAKFNTYAAVLAAAVVCPVVNTGVFLLGCLVFFLPTLTEWAAGASVWKFMLFVLVGGNFLFELGFNVVLSPIIVRLLRISKKLR